MNRKEKIKTLKDIIPCGVSCDWNTELKEEAIKWINLMDRYPSHYYSHPDTRKWIKHFFNIKEKEIKC